MHWSWATTHSTQGFSVARSRYFSSETPSTENTTESNRDTTRSGAVTSSYESGSTCERVVSIVSLTCSDGALLKVRGVLLETTIHTRAGSMLKGRASTIVQQSGLALVLGDVREQLSFDRGLTTTFTVVMVPR